MYIEAAAEDHQIRRIHHKLCNMTVKAQEDASPRASPFPKKNIFGA